MMDLSVDLMVSLSNHEVVALFLPPTGFSRGLDPREASVRVGSLEYTP